MTSRTASSASSSWKSASSAASMASGACAPFFPTRKERPFQMQSEHARAGSTKRSGERLEDAPVTIAKRRHDGRQKRGAAGFRQPGRAPSAIRSGDSPKSTPNPPFTCRSMNPGAMMRSSVTEGSGSTAAIRSPSSVIAREQRHDRAGAVRSARSSNEVSWQDDAQRRAQVRPRYAPPPGRTDARSGRAPCGGSRPVRPASSRPAPATPRRPWKSSACSTAPAAAASSAAPLCTNRDATGSQASAASKTSRAQSAMTALSRS